MNLDKLHKCMVFMMNVSENTEIQMFGNALRNFLIIFLLQLLFKTKYFAYMVVYLLALKRLIKLVNLIEFKRHLMKGQYVTYFGLTQMIEWDGEYLQEELVILLDKTLVNNLINKIILS